MTETKTNFLQEKLQDLKLDPQLIHQYDWHIWLENEEYMHLIGLARNINFEEGDIIENPYENESVFIVSDIDHIYNRIIVELISWNPNS